MPRLLHVTTSFENGAIPNILLDLAPHWTRAGWEVEFLTLESLPEDHASVQRCRALGYRLSALGVAPRSAVRALLGLRQAIRRIGPDLIHTHLGRADIYTPWIKGAIPMVTTFHSVRQNSGRLTQWGWKWSDRRVAHRTGVSQACLDSVYADGFLTSPHSVIYNPVDPQRLAAHRDAAAVRSQWGWAPDTILLLAVGRLVPVKDHATLIRAFASLAAFHPRLRLLIAGDGPLRSELEALIHSEKLEGRAVLAGSVTVADLYHAADLVVFPSLWEGLGLVPLEALACGCPVASSRLPAVAEFLTDGVTGRFFEPGDRESLVRCVEKVLTELDLARAEAERGRTMVQERFDPERIAVEYEHLYRSVLRGRSDVPQSS